MTFDRLAARGDAPARGNPTSRSAVAAVLRPRGDFTVPCAHRQYTAAGVPPRAMSGTTGAYCQDLPTDPGTPDRYSASISRQVPVMNTFALLTFVGTMGVIVSFLSGARAMTRHNGSLGEKTSLAWRMVFDLTVFTTILAAPLAG